MLGAWLLENRLMRMIEMGKVAKPDIVRAGKAGMFKPYKMWKAGIDKGTENILKKEGYKVRKELKNPLTSFQSSYPKVVALANPKNVHPQERGAASLFARHEADEARSMGKYFPKDKKDYKVASVGYHAKRQPDFYGHAGPEVLNKEEKYTNVAAALYGKKSGGHINMMDRGASGAYIASKDVNAAKVHHKLMRDISTKNIQVGKQLIKTKPKESIKKLAQIKTRINSLASGRRGDLEGKSVHSIIKDIITRNKNNEAIEKSVKKEVKQRVSHHKWQMYRTKELQQTPSWGL